MHDRFPFPPTELCHLPIGDSSCVIRIRMNVQGFFSFKITFYFISRVLHVENKLKSGGIEGIFRKIVHRKVDQDFADIFY